MSDLDGEGYGSSHDWKTELTGEFRFNGITVPGTRYRCRACGELFVHPFEAVSGPFEAMEYRGVTDQCPAIMGANADTDNPDRKAQTDAER